MRPTLSASLAFGLLIVAVLACSPSENRNSTNTAAKPDPKNGLTQDQKNDLHAIMKLTDQCDSVAKNRAKIKTAWAYYLAEYTKADDKYRTVRPTLAKGDARMTLDGMMKAYESIGQILLARHQGKKTDSPDDWVILAGMRKELLKRVVENNIPPEWYRLMQTLRENDQ